MHLPLITLSPHIASLFICFMITNPVAFYLSRYVVFQETAEKRRKQVLKFMIMLCVNFSMGYLLMKLLVEVLFWYPTPAKVLINVIIVASSYLFQRKFIFRRAKGR